MGTRRRRVSVIYFISKLVKWDDLRMEVISYPTQVDIEKAAKALIDGHLVAFPTETVYGLGADATNEKAVSGIYSIKGRPENHPLIVHISSISQLENWVRDIPEYAIKLGNTFWPGPMTLVLKRSALAMDFITGGQDSIGIRVPDQQVALLLTQEFEKLGGSGIAAPSANRFGSVSPTTAQAVEEELGRFLGNEDLILDDGQCEIGVESSIIDCTQVNPAVLRPGAITNEMIEQVSGLKILLKSEENEIRAPGLLESHYAPKANVILGMAAKPGDGFIALTEVPTPIGAIRLASPASIEDYARDLYKALRLGDQYGLNRISVIQPEGTGLAVAIRDRLGKAASGKFAKN
jgi:L-threonylcarbamoyladenylate synthase